VLFETAEGEVMLDAIQVRGPSSSGRGRGWRAFDVRFIRGLEVLDESFERDPELNLRTPKYHRIIASSAP
jgi:hypothetical protein